MLSRESLGRPCSFLQLWASLYFHIPFRIACGFSFRALHPCLGIPPYFMSSRIIGFEMVSISGGMNTRRLYKQQRPGPAWTLALSWTQAKDCGKPFLPAKMSCTPFPPGRLCLNACDTRCLLSPSHPTNPQSLLCHSLVLQPPQVISSVTDIRICPCCPMTLLPHLSELHVTLSDLKSGKT